jgi:hypothetical protein
LAALAGALPLLAGQVADNALVAQRNLRALWSAEAIYSNDNQEWFPLDPAWLYDLGMVTPETFFHPGDPNNSPPTTINNSASNAPNSARISFDFLITQPSRHLSDEIAIRDNTAWNNAGQFINFVTLDGVVETDPPGATETPTTFTLAEAHLSRLVWAVRLYASDDPRQHTPDTLLVFWTPGARAGWYGSTRTFWNPGDADALPDTLTNDLPNDPQSVQVSFDYLTPNTHWESLPPQTPILRDNTPANNQGYGVFEARADLRVRFVPVCPGDTDLDRDVDLLDLARLQAHYGIRDERITPADGDIDADGGVFEPDLEMLATNLGLRCP